MVELDAVWGTLRYIKINGKPVRVPFGVELESSLIDWLPKWIKHSGTSFASKRTKALKTWALHILGGEKDYSEPWFAKVRYKGFVIPKLKLFNTLIDQLNNLKVIRMILIVLNSYKLVVIGKPSLDSITNCDVSPPSDIYVSKLRLYCKLPRVPSDVLGAVDAVNTKKKYSDDMGETFPGPYGYHDKEYYEDYEVGESLACYSLGRVIPIKDKGKWRNILVGNWKLQLQTKKLADWLRQWLWDQPEVASGWQSKMSDFCIRSLKEGRYMMSIDLSEATDRLSRDLQIKLLISMGVPKAYLGFLELPFWYHPKEFGIEGDLLESSYYANGQPMGLYLSFPMFELSHYVILKFATAPYKANFCICGDDVVIACESEDAVPIYQRYERLISRFGGVISKPKTVLSSRLAEGVGAVFLKHIPKEIRIASGKVSSLEAFTPGTWLYQQVSHTTRIGRALMYAWLSTKLTKQYSYQQRTYMNERLVVLDRSYLSVEALRTLFKVDHMPREYSIEEENDFDFWRNTPEDQDIYTYRWVAHSKYMSALVDNKIISLIKKDLPHVQRQRTLVKGDLFL